ncbi:lytic transglycosylase domain-containing protein [Altererythrobacter sp. GH1-8]|uniref:lytic transglycosylase domain-containing protein n=1 Tax=Altererythrobacter sp. GH1-8 TaxID=3349333 RepID=UPI00374D73BB
MSSMDSTVVPHSGSKFARYGNATTALAIAASSLAFLAVSLPATAQAPGLSDQARGSLIAQQPTGISQAVARWEFLTEARNTDLGFDAYAGFALKYPEFPRTSLIRVRAENALEKGTPSSETLVGYFDRHPPLTNPARARYALALAALQRSEAEAVAREAWRGGKMSSPSEAYLFGGYSSAFTQADHDARMDALLWQGEEEAARRQIAYVSASKRDMFAARLALVEDKTPSSIGLTVPEGAWADPGYVYNLSRYYRTSRQVPAAVNLLANRSPFAKPVHDPEDMVGEMLSVAKAANADSAVRIASKVDDLFEPGYDVSNGSFALRDRYTDLMWLGGTKALWEMGDGAKASPLFYRYGLGAKTPLTRSKGFYWAGRAARQAGFEAKAVEYFEQAAAFPHYYYGQLALSALGKPMPNFAAMPQVTISAEKRAEFNARSDVQALRAMAKDRRDWRTERRFFEAISDAAQSPEDMTLVAQLAGETGLDEFAVVAGMSAGEHGLSGFERLGFPTVDTPPGTYWTMVHAISRQESEFDRTRVSHAGARGVMQLMPGTAREQAGKIGMHYMSADLTADPLYNIRLGDGYFKRMLDYYDGSYPLAFGAYNAGPGRVNQWIRMNGDPRTGAIDYQTWIEKIPANFETRYYIMRVLGNAVTYSNMYPDKAGTPRTIDYYLQK